jgi:putative ABC transport system permease protein
LEHPLLLKAEKESSIATPLWSALSQRPDLRLAILNLLHDKIRFTVTVVGIAFSVFLMAFQACLLAGFDRAAAAIINATEGQIWISARGVRSFDMGNYLPERFRDLAYSVNDVVSVSRLVASFSSFLRPDGQSTDVMLVGADEDVGRGLPVPSRNFSGDSLAVDYTARDLLGLNKLPVDVELEHHRATVVQYTSGFGTFLCCAYTFSNYSTALNILQYPPDQTMYLIVGLRNNVNVRAVRDQLRAKLPEADVWTKEEFASRSQTFWLTQTGAGAALVGAAFLGFVVGSVIISQTIYATTMENLDEYATLKAIGASKLTVCGIVLVQGLISGAAGCVVGLACVVPCARLALSAIPWLYVPWWVYPWSAGLTLVMCTIAPITSVRSALFVDPARVFRA